MRNNDSFSRLLLIGFSLTLCVCFTGCSLSGGGARSIIRYQSVSIPAYARTDYETIVITAQKDNDQLTNAVCELIPYAGRYADALTKEACAKPENDPAESDPISHETARRVFGAMTRWLAGSGENTKAAALLFLAEFSKSYKDKQQLVGLISSLDADNVRIEFEQVKALLNLVGPDVAIDSKLIEKFLDSGSWRVRSLTYGLLGAMNSEEFHPRLMDVYLKSDLESDKMMILYAFNQKYGSDVFQFLMQELLGTKSDKIRKTIIGMFSANKNDSEAGMWFAAHYSELDGEMIREVIDQYAFKLSSNETGFFNVLLSGNRPDLHRLLVPGAFFEALYNQLDKPSNNNILNLWHAVLKNRVLAEEWRSYSERRKREQLADEEKARREKHFEQVILPRYTVMLDSFLNDSEKLLAEGGMSADEIKETTASIRELLQLLKNGGKQSQTTAE